MLLIYFSKEDEFSMNVLKTLVPDVKEDYLMYTKEVIFCITSNFLFVTNETIEKDFEKIKKDFNLNGNQNDLEILVISKHKSQHDHHLITLHYTGNFNNAELGGQDYTLSIANTHIFGKLLEKIKESKNPKFFIEATHHGPTLKYPSLFFEIGPNDESYKNKNNIDNYVSILKDLINDANTPGNNAKKKTFCLIGAGHYIDFEEYSKILQKIKEKMPLVDTNELVVGHIMPKYALNQLIENKEKFEILIKEMITKSNANFCVINRSYAKSSDLIAEIIKKEGKEVIKI